jgi:hypothetical protein
MPQDKVKEVYDLISELGYFEDENEFRNYVSDPKKRKEAFSLISDAGYFEDENEFNSYFESEKKKPSGELFSQDFPTFRQGVGQSVSKPSQSPLKSQSTTTTTPLPKTAKFENVDIRKPELEKQKYDKVQERNRIQNYSQGLQKVQLDATKKLRDRDILLDNIDKLQVELEASKGNPEQYNVLVPKYNELVNAAKDINNQLSSDFDKIDIFEKGIGVTELKRQINEDTVGNRALEGVNNTKRLLLEVLPATAQFGSYLTMRSRGIDQVTAEKVSTEIAEKGFSSLKKLSREIASENEELSSVFEQKSAWDVLTEEDKKLLEKDWAKIGDLATKELVQTLPLTLGLMATYINPIVGATATIMGTAGMELEELQGSNMTPDAKIANALTKGGLEYVTEKIFGSIPMLKRAIGLKSKAGQEAYQNIVLQTWNKFAAKMGFPADVIEEVGSEMLNTIGGNYTDYISGKTTEVDLYKGLGETFTTSLTMAATLSGGGRAIKYGSKKINELREATKKLKEIAESQETTPEVLQVIEEKILENNEKIANEAAGEKKVFDAMNDDTWEEATALIQETQALEEQLENNEVPEEVIPIVEAKIKESYEKVEAIKEEVKTAEEIAIERLEAAKIKLDESTTKKEANEESLPSGVSGLRNESESGQESPELRTNQEEVVQDEPTISEGDTPKGDTRVEVAEPTIQEGEGQVEVEEKADIETRKNALRELMAATGEVIYEDAVADGSFNGEGFLDMDSEGNIVLTRFADTQDNLTKGGIEVSPEDLQRGANNHSNTAISTSAVEGGVVSYAKEGGVIGKYKIPMKELIQLMKDGHVYFAGIGNKEFVLSPHIAAKYLSTVNGSKVNQTNKEVAKEQTKEAPKPLETKEEVPAKEQKVENKEQGTESTRTENVSKKEQKIDTKAEWDSDEGKKKIEGEITIGGKDYYTISIDGKKSNQLILKSELNKEIDFDESNFNDKVESDKIRLENETKEKLDAEEVKNLNGFGSDLTPMQLGKVVKDLNKKESYNGVLKTRKKAIEDFVKEGRTVETLKNGKRVLQKKDGTFLDSLTKIELDYAEFLIANPENKVEPTAEKTLDAKNEPNKVVEKTLEGGKPKETPKAETETKAEKKAKVEKKIDDIAERLKKKFAITTLPQGTKKSGFSQEDLIDLIANVAKEIAKKGIDIKEAIKQVIADLKENGDLEGFDEVDIEAKSNEILTPETKKPESVVTKTSKHFETITNNKSLNELTKDLKEEDYQYQEISRQSNRDVAVAYVEENGVEVTLNKFNGSNGKIEGLTDAQSVAVGRVLYRALNSALLDALKNNDIEQADYIKNEMAQVTSVVQKFGTGAGQAISQFADFALDFSDPLTAVFSMQKHVEAVNKAQRESGAVKTNSNLVAKDINNTVKNGKKKVVKEVVKTVNEELYGLITLGKKGLTDTQKQKVKNIFNTFKVDPNGNVKASAVPIKELIAFVVTPKIYNQVIDKVGELVAEGVSLSVAMTRVSTEFIKNKIATPEQMAAARKALNEQVKGLKETKPLTEKQKEAKAAREELKEETEKFNQKEKLEKELEKERKKAEDLREKEAKKVLDEVEKLELQRLRQSIKDTEKAIKELISEIPKTDTDLVNELVSEYLQLSPEQKTTNRKLIEMVMDKLGVDERAAKVIATKIAEGVAKNIKKKLENKFANQLSAEERAAKAKGVKPKANPLDEIIAAADTGIAPELVQEYFKNKYGIEELSVQDIQTIQEISKKIAAAPTENRKGVLLGQIQRAIDSKRKKTLAELFQNLWYARVLSPVLLQIPIGTGDTNITYNLITLFNQVKIYPLTSGLNLVTNLKKTIASKKPRTKGELLATITGSLQEAILGAFNALGQNVIYNEAEQNKVKKFLSVLTNSRYLSQSLSYYRTAITDGLDYKKEHDNPFKATAGGKFDISDWSNTLKKAENGDKSAQNKVALAVRAVINGYVNGVTNTLGGQDLFFGSIIGNLYKPALLREKFFEEGFRGKELNAKVFESIVNTKLEYENARQKAIDYRMKFDITIKPKVNARTNELTYEVKDNGKLKETFSSKEDAETYAREKLAPKGNNFRNDVNYLLNQKIGDIVNKQSERISRNLLLSGDVEGGTRYINNFLQAFQDLFAKWSETLNDKALANNLYDALDIKNMALNLDFKTFEAIYKKAKSIIFKSLAIPVKALENLLAFKRVGLNAVRMASNFITPLGLLRYSASFYSKGENSMGLTGEMSYKMTDTERNQILAMAIVGGLTFQFGAIVKKAIQDALKGDDEEEKKEITKDKENSQRLFKEWYKNTTGEEITKEINAFYSQLTKGQVIGSLSWMTDDRKKFYERTGLLVEYSVFEGFNEQGKPMFSTVKNRPEQALNISVATYQLIDAFGDEDDKDNILLYSAMTPLYSWKDMSIGQGGISILFSRPTAERLFEKVAQIAVLDNFEVLNPRIIPVTLGYFDQKARKTPTLFESIQNEATIYGGVKDWMFMRVAPAYAGYNQAMKATQIYGMFGEEIYRIPNESQGMVSNIISEYVKSDKNMEEQKMQMWLDINGYNKKIWTPNKDEPILVDGKAKELTYEQLNKYGRIGGEKTLKELKSKLKDLQELRQVGEEEDASTEQKRIDNFRSQIDEIFKKNFQNAYFEGENTFGSDTKRFIEKKNELFDESFALKIEKVKNKSEMKFELDKEFGTTKEEQADRAMNKSIDQYLSEMKGLSNTEKEERLERLVSIGSISENEYILAIRLINEE